LKWIAAEPVIQVQKRMIDHKIISVKEAKKYYNDEAKNPDQKPVRKKTVAEITFQLHCDYKKVFSTMSRKN